MVLIASGKETRGQGTARATVTATLTEHDGGTAVSVRTDLTVTGRPAQFGRGVMAEVGDKLVGQFATCLSEQLGPATTPEAEPTPADSSRVSRSSLGAYTAATTAPLKTRTSSMTLRSRSWEPGSAWKVLRASSARSVRVLRPAVPSLTTSAITARPGRMRSPYGGTWTAVTLGTPCAGTACKREP